MGSYTVLLAKLISKELLALRRRLSLTQEAMAEHLHISCRAYGDLERGKYAISAATLMFLFPMFDPNMQQRLFQQFAAAVQSFEESAEQVVHPEISSVRGTAYAPE